MKVKSKRKMAGILAAVLIALVLLAFDCINGDPISERWAMHRAIQFAEKLYPDQTFTAENAGSMRGFCYTTRVQSQQSRDTRFYVETQFLALYQRYPYRLTTPSMWMPGSTHAWSHGTRKRGLTWHRPWSMPCRNMTFHTMKRSSA